jgi:hypothetical protein
MGYKVSYHLHGPIPAKLCTVIPLILIAEIPVGAVTATASSPYLLTNSWITYRNKKLYCIIVLNIIK